MAGVQLLDDPAVLAAVSTPLRRQLFERLQQPASATELAGELGLSRQAVNYHVRALERLGLLEVVGERQRRGFVERVLQAKARRLVVDPSVLSPDGGASLPSPAALDRHAAEHLATTAEQLVRDVTAMQAAADAAGRRLLTFTVEADVRVGSPAEVEQLATAIADAVEQAAATFDTPGGRHYRVVVGGHPNPRRAKDTRQGEA